MGRLEEEALRMYHTNVVHTLTASASVVPLIPVASKRIILLPPSK